jgi:L-serine/L-threonine ammonia-lyase
MSLNGERFNTVDQKLPAGVDIVEDEETGLKLAHFNGFTSKASGSLGASQPAGRVVKMALERKGGVKCVTVPDELSMQALGSFAGIFDRYFVKIGFDFNMTRRPQDAG